jgi:uncharacterized protein (DUF2236 family)
MQVLRDAIRQHVHGLVGQGSETRERRADQGLFGPQSVCWRVHRDFSAMMIGGTAALLMQMLHPSALAGVWDHTNFRQDPTGRLRRTARFIAATTYGSRQQAIDSIGKVRTIHSRVHGILPDGSAYTANDPALLTWVHTAEATCFLNGYLRYRNPFLSPDDQDRYLRETAEIARRLGATRVPVTRREVGSYLRSMRPYLRADDRTRTIVQAILSNVADGSSPAAAPVRTVMQEAAVDLLPDWAAIMHQLSIAPIRKPFVRAGALGAAAVLRWALR